MNEVVIEGGIHANERNDSVPFLTFGGRGGGGGGGGG